MSQWFVVIRNFGSEVNSAITLFSDCVLVTNLTGFTHLGAKVTKLTWELNCDFR